MALHPFDFLLSFVSYLLSNGYLLGSWTNYSVRVGFVDKLFSWSWARGRISRLELGIETRYRISFIIRI